ncbi:MAG TPA: PhnD/SsuA/transferrin family substrate-binding protein, partial [Anaerolineae bacterium]|nr:PhnD/SsuA/transferrin family substrate-binding protein [Anaerolineae bacterium]
CDAGATFVDARGSVEADFPDVKEKVIQVYVSEPFIPNDTVSYAKSLPQDIRDKITNALLEIAPTEEGKAALASVYEIEGLQKVDDTFFDELRVILNRSGLDLEKLAAPDG